MVTADQTPPRGITIQSRPSKSPHKMRLPDSAHTSRDWRVHELAGDFELEDVWEPPLSGDSTDFERLIQLAVSLSAGYEYPAAFRALFALRWKLGELFGWDEADAGIDERVPSLRDRLPADLRSGPRGPDLRAVPGRDSAEAAPIFRSLYQTQDEWLTEYASETVHSLMHIGWVADDDCYRAQMTVLVKPNGWLGKAYMFAIKPTRYILYPMQLRAFARQWETPEKPRRVNVADPVAAARPHDYADAFEVRIARTERCSPEEWLRAGVDEYPAWIKQAAGHFDGSGSFRIVESDANLVVLEASGSLMDTVMVGRNVDAERRVLTTLLRFRRPRIARTIWLLVGIFHRRTAREVVAGGLPSGEPKRDGVSSRCD